VSDPQVLNILMLTQLLLIELESLYLLHTALAAHHQLYPCVGRESNEPIPVAFQAGAYPTGSEPHYQEEHAATDQRDSESVTN